MKKLFFTLTFIFVFLFSFSQSGLRIAQNSNNQNVGNRLELAQANSENELENSINRPELNQSPFDAVKGKKEIPSKRDQYSKTYQNEDGSFTALIGAGPIHYDNNGVWEDIDTKIIPNGNENFPYKNTTNLFSSFYGATAHKGIRSVTPEGEVLEFQNVKMAWEVNGQTVNNINAANSSVTINNDIATYPNLFGNIGAELTSLVGKRELNYVIPNAQALSNAPANAEYLVFTEEINLPTNWTATSTERGIEVKDNTGEVIYLYPKPVSTDANVTLRQEENTIYEMNQNGTVLTLKTKVKTEWLLSAEREFPVKVDPTTSATANGGRSVYNDGDEENLGYYGRVSVYWLQYHVKFNTSSIPSGSTVSAVVGYFYLWGTAGTRHASSQWAWFNSADPTTTSGTDLYTSATALQSTAVATNQTAGWKNSTFTATGRTYVSNGINNQNYVAAAVYPSGTWNNGQYYGARTHNDGGFQPYLSITYTAPATAPSCATLIGPQDNATGIGQSGLIAWNVVGGATSYDVYFGTDSNPPLVASNQTGTTYTVGPCLLPNTIYYWKVIAKNANGSATGCSTWKFTTDGKLHIYQNNFNDANPGVFGTSGASVDGWYTNNNSATGGAWNNGYNNTWTLGNGPNAIDGYSVGVSALNNGGLGGNYFQYWSNLGEIHRWIYRPFDMRGLRDIEVSFRWKAGGEANQDYGLVATSINGGANWLTDNQGGLNSDGKYWNSPSTIRSQTIVFPETRNNQQNFQLAFKWDDLSGNEISQDPSFVVDDIVVKACPYEGVISSDKVASGIFEWTPPNSNTQTSLTVGGSHSCAMYQWEQSTNNGATWTNISEATSSSYITPSDLTVTTLYRAKVYYGTGCTGAYQENAFKVNITVPMTCASLTNLNVQLGNPFNGANHYIDFSWDPLTGATGYDIQYSDDNSTWFNASPASVSTNFASLNMGDNPNVKYWFRVRAKSASETCDWTYSDPIYTACDMPRTPLLSNAVGNSLDLTIQPELPVANPSHTEYAIYCTSTDQYVQADGSLGATQVWKTKANWGTVNITGLSMNTEYCFYVIARNGDGHIVGMQEGNLNTIVSNTFDTNANFSNVGGSGPTNVWWAPGSSSSGTFMTYNSGLSKCGTNGYVGFSGTYNNYHGTFLRSPSVNCTGNETITLTMDLSNAGTNRQYDYIKFYMWADNTYKYGANANGTGSDQLPFGTGRTCETITVVFDISAIADKSSILFYIAPSCGYNDGVSYFYEIKNVSISINNITYDPPTACITTSSAETPVFHNFGGSTQLSFNYSKHNNDKPVFRLSHSGANATKYEIQVNTKSDFTGTSWAQTYTGSYAGNTETNFEFTQATGNLTSGTTYYVRARIDQGSGWGMWTSELYSFTYNTSTTIPEWFKTTTPQFNTDDLVGTINQSDELKPEVSGGGTLNPFINPSFEQTGGWSSSTNSPDIFIHYDHQNWKSNGNYSARMYLYGGYLLSSDYAFISQKVDLTGVGKIIFDAQSHFGSHMGANISHGNTLKLIISDSQSGTGGTELASIYHCVNGSSPCTNETLNVTGIVPESLRAPNKYVKFVWSGFSSGSTGGSLISFSVDNIRAEAPSFFNSIITTTPSYISSIQNAIGYDKIIWNQTLGAKAAGDIKITIQGSTDGLSFSDITDFVDMPAPDGSGQKNIDISSISPTNYPYLRAIFYLNNENTILHDFGFSYKNTPLPVKLLSFTSECENDKINFAWSTASEINSDCFEIIETKDFVNFNSLAKIYAAGFSSQTIIYNYQAKANYGKTYYQLKQYDVDGNWEILSTIFVDCTAEQDNEIYIYPNPNKGEEIIIASNSEIFEAIILIYDAAGRLVKEFIFKDFGIENKIIFKPKLEPGVYLLVVKNLEKEYKQFKFIVN